MDVKEQIKRSVSITDVVSMYVNLKPAGKNLKALCPFHNEKTASFFVTPEKDSFSCYGCNKFGDIFTFIQEIENLSFVEAMDFLIDKFNIPIVREQKQSVVKKDVYVKINEIALNYFRARLLDSAEGKQALDYLEKRGIQRRTVDIFSMGYAENMWDGLYNHLRKKSIDIRKAIELGLLVKGNNDRIYDRFRGRIIFPIMSESGTPIAFGGRTIFDEPNKYLNSPDTPLYKKSKHLYGFNLTKQAIRDKKHAILVEGYFDVVSLYQGGVENVAASLGTALTEQQIYLLKRFADKIYLFYDSDKAGIEAAVRGIEKMFEQNINPRIITLENTKDPDDFIRENGLKAFNQLLQNARDGFRFLLDHLSRQYDINIPEQKNRAVQSVLDYVNKIKETIIRNEYIQITADRFKVDEKLLKTTSAGNRPKQEPEKGQRLKITPAERIFLESVLAMPKLIGEIKELLTPEILSVLASGKIIRQLLDHFNNETNDIDDFKELATELSDAERGEFREIFEHARDLSQDQKQLEKNVETGYLEFIDILAKQNSRRIDRQLRIAVRENNMDLVQQLIQQKSNYVKKKFQHVINHSNHRRPPLEQN